MTPKIEFDYGPLERPIPFREGLRATGEQLKRDWLAVLIFGAVLTFIGGNVGASFLASGVLPLVLVALGLVACGGFGWFLLGRAKNRLRLQRFAMSNQLEFIEREQADDKPGLIFNQGHSRQITTALKIARPWLEEMGNYEYVTGSGKHQQTHDFGYLEIKLPRRLPNMVLDARDNNFLGRFSNLPSVFDRDQILRLEGNFNEHFTLYAPKQYETDALYVFTPDVMQTLIDEGSRFDMEVVGDRLYIYSARPLKLSDSAALRRLFAMSARIATQLIEQVDYYADSRVGDRQANIVAEPGRRLKVGFSWLIVGIVVIIAVFQLAPVLLSLF